MSCARKWNIFLVITFVVSFGIFSVLRNIVFFLREFWWFKTKSRISVGFCVGFCPRLLFLGWYYFLLCLEYFLRDPVGRRGVGVLAASLSQCFLCSCSFYTLGVVRFLVLWDISFVCEIVYQALGEWRVPSMYTLVNVWSLWSFFGFNVRISLVFFFGVSVFVFLWRLGLLDSWIDPEQWRSWRVGILPGVSQSVSFFFFLSSFILLFFCSLLPGFVYTFLWCIAWRTLRSFAAFFVFRKPLKNMFPFLVFVAFFFISCIGRE